MNQAPLGVHTYPYQTRTAGLLPRIALWALASVALFGGVAGCGSKPGLTMQSVDSGVRFVSELPVAVYRFRDRNTADVYMTDLPREALDAEADIFGVSGQLVHIHLFVTPAAGDTPIDDTACSASIRHVVISQGQVGVYAGGGFLLPGDKPGEPQFTGTINGATLRLVSASKGFVDRLGAVEMAGVVKAPLNEPMSAALADRLRTLIELTASVGERAVSGER